MQNYSKNEYIEFINNNNNYTEYQKKYFNMYLENIDKHYINRSSNTQINEFVKLTYSSGDFDQIAKSDILFGKFYGGKYKFLINKIKLNELTKDSDIIKYMKSNKSSFYKQNKKNSIIRNEWKYMIENICFKLSKITDIYNIENVKYLDICCGDGKKTEYFGNFLKIPTDEIYGCDIKTWGPYSENKHFKFNFSFIENDKLNYDDNYFDILTITLSLHHVEKLDDFIDEIYRILKPNGLLIIIEHNVLNDIEQMFIDIQHYFFEQFYDLANVKNTSKDITINNNNNYTKCYNMMEWDFIFHKHNLKNIHNEILFPELENRIRYDIVYYGVFVK
jgi:ubiquinone/menaquinone biosynthesis C-methylase UbiE